MFTWFQVLGYLFGDQQTCGFLCKTLASKIQHFCPKVRYEQLAGMVGLTGQMVKSQEEVES